ncbi:type I-U CRISPR-associated protein Cas8c [Bremerella cremea]|uniref:Type I-U CRISPR-associated protein Cas8c n=1 Tax=Bremerella cremea TaxID=1031537 RepID=A0A368KX33_9BACT|nr:type I-U CRISPR-associated protein Cas8c [Bremerella cremea]RCS55774.1 type I-U CRISPR-associated protein Cas8c [Bremerella cremea]
MTHPKPTITVDVDVTNPGQFFACCGLLEIADRLWPGAEGWFEDSAFCIDAEGTLSELWCAIVDAELDALDPGDETASPMRLGAPIDLTLDWWKDEHAGGRMLKVWAGSMRGVRIAQSMKAAIANVAKQVSPFDYSAVVYDPDNTKKKVEPFYYDARRGWNAQPIDIGFSPDSLKMISAAYPAVEFMCLVGLQRFRPRQTKQRRVFEYRTWRTPLSPSLAAAVASGVMPLAADVSYRFENAFRTDQKKHKAFLPATPLGASQ